MLSIDLFIKSWSEKSTMVAIKSADISELESTMNINLPRSYKYLVSTYGLLHTPNVLTSVCALEGGMSEVQDFLSLDDVVSLSSLYEMTGMPKGHILFASDCKGNMFCFKRTDCNIQHDDAAVWYFDRSQGTVTIIIDSFITWLTAFNEINV